MEFHKGKAFFEMSLVICSIFAFAFIINESLDSSELIKYENKISWKKILWVTLKIIFSDKNFVSALDSSDLNNGVYTCSISNDGSLCQEYPSSECNSNCNGQCFPSTRNNAPGCKLGTCYDASEGTCQERTPQSVCENSGGKWFENNAGNIPQCQKRCCVINDRVKPLVTERECEAIGERLGIDIEFRNDIVDELSCLALASIKSEGACVFEEGCRFLTADSCVENGGEFYEGWLCSHPDLKSECEKQASAQCFEGKDELYWFDSCGNRENIYDANKIRSWNEGKVLAKSESCSLDNLDNQNTCGNCNRLIGSVCREKTSSEKLSDDSIDFVCKELRCRDNTGKVRENGESWCEYQGDTGAVQGTEPRKGKTEENRGFLRSADTPGSRHFRAACIDGEVQINSCQDYRNEICVEQQFERDDGEDISSSACVKNLWQLCIEYNTELQDAEGKEEIEEAIEKRNEKCLENPTCILKSVDVDKGFAFDLCVPRVAPGFDLQTNPEGAEIACSLGTNECKALFVKEISGWDCKFNCDCLTKEFGEQMNDLCMSLGDCGASVNYLGDLSESYNIEGRTPKELDDSYLGEISKYSDIVEGKYLEINASQYLEVVGGAEKLGEYSGDANQDNLESLSAGAGVAGAFGGILTIAPGLVGYSAGFVTGLVTSGEAVGLAVYLGNIFSGAVAGAAIGFAITSMLIQFTGIGAGLDPAIVWTLVGAGALAGGAIGFSVASEALATGAFGCIDPITCIVAIIFLIVIILTIVVLDAIGVGDTKELKIKYQCNVWQPPLGGAKCGECGSDGYPCSKYSCQSLGATCRLINEGSEDETCTDISPNDVTPPIISANEEFLSDGYKYEQESGGVRIVSEEGECVSGDATITFGLNINEPSQCVYDFESRNSFEEMESNFGNRNVFIEEHVQTFSGFELRESGDLDLPEYEPDARVDLDYHIRCRDANGNENLNEYIVSLCVRPGEDIQNPIVTLREPTREEVAIDAENVNGRVFLSEPSSCRWSEEKVRYNSMINNMSCLTGKNDRHPLFGWRCSAQFPFVEDEDIIYIDCLDQPWNNQTEERRALSEVYEFKMKRTENPLMIDSISPSGVLEFGIVPATVVLELKTSGGVENGKATCRLFGREMSETFRDLHKQTFDQIFGGNYEFPVLCEDRVGNIAESIVQFNAVIDVSSPRVTRVFNDAGILKVITDEESECAYVKGTKKSDRQNCNFDFEEGILMSGFGFSHTTDFDSETYYIKCKDKWENVPGTCSVIVRSGGI